MRLKEVAAAAIVTLFVGGAVNGAWAQTANPAPAEQGGANLQTGAGTGSVPTAPSAATPAPDPSCTQTGNSTPSQSGKQGAGANTVAAANNYGTGAQNGTAGTGCP